MVKEPTEVVKGNYLIVTVEYAYGEWVPCPGYDGKSCGGRGFGCPTCRLSGKTEQNP